MKITLFQAISIWILMFIVYSMVSGYFKCHEKGFQQSDWRGVCYKTEIIYEK